MVTPNSMPATNRPKPVRKTRRPRPIRNTSLADQLKQKGFARGR